MSHHCVKYEGNESIGIDGNLNNECCRDTLMTYYDV